MFRDNQQTTLPLPLNRIPKTHMHALRSYFRLLLLQPYQQVMKHRASLIHVLSGISSFLTSSQQIGGSADTHECIHTDSSIFGRFWCLHLYPRKLFLFETEDAVLPIEEDWDTALR